jgi:hypothetical protein
MVELGKLSRHRWLHTTNQNRSSIWLPNIGCQRSTIAKILSSRSCGDDQAEPFKRVLVMIDKILKDANLSDIPVEQSTRFEFTVNLKTARQLGLTIPPNVL